MTVLFATLFAALLGVAFCFFGYRIFLVMLPIWGFFGGFWLGAMGVSLIFGTGFLATVTGWTVGFVVGLVFALFSYLFYVGGVALLAASFGAAVGSGFMALFGLQTGFLVLMVSIICALIMAVLTLALNLQKYVIIAMTAVGGANAILLAVMLMLGQVSLEGVQRTGNAIQLVLQGSLFWSLVWLIVGVIGIVVQLRVNQSYSFSKERFVEGWS